MLNWLTRWLRGEPARTPRRSSAAPRRRRFAAKFDAVQTTPENRRHWANADDLAPDAAASPEIRRIFRMRGRYEQFNNPYADGMLQTLAMDNIGNGPRLQMLTNVEKIDTLIEQEFREWMEAVGLAEKLRLMIENRAAVGECFALLTANPKQPAAVKLNLVLLEPEQVATPNPWSMQVNPDAVDGIVFDRYGNPVEYHVLRRHPGDTAFMGLDDQQYDRVPARDMIHLFKTRRPGQRRGIPQITSALPIFAERRGFRQAVVQAARVAAEMGAIMLETDAAGDDESNYDNDLAPFTSMEIERGMMSMLPNGYKAKQMAPAQPSTTYREFDDKLINEQARPLGIPFNIAALNSSSYNYASGRLDHQTYDRNLFIEHGDLERKALNVLLTRWFQEALLIPGYLPHRTRFLVQRRIPHRWMWKGRPHVDPVKEATAADIRLNNMTTSLSDELSLDGVDIESHLRQLAREESLRKKYGLPRLWEQAERMVRPALPPDDDEPKEPEEDDSGEEGEGNDDGDNGNEAGGGKGRASGLPDAGDLVHDRFRRNGRSHVK